MIHLLLIVLALPLVACAPAVSENGDDRLKELANEDDIILYRYEDSEVICFLTDGAYSGALQCFQKKEPAK